MILNGPVVERAIFMIQASDLQHLADLARADREEFFARNPRWGRLYADRVLCVTLCQGAALHYVNGRNGVKDFDVWTFYAEQEEAPFPYRRRGCRDFGPSPFGRHPDEAEYSGRRVDFIGRSIPAFDLDPVASIQAYLAKRRSESAMLLAGKAVVVLEPANLFGRVIWPIDINLALK